MEETQAMAILADPFAEEENWLTASSHVRRKFKPIVLRGPEQEFADVAFGSIAGLIVTFSAGNVALLTQHWMLATATYLFLANAGILGLVATRKVRRPRLLVTFTLSVSLSLFLTAMISILFPPGWQF